MNSTCMVEVGTDAAVDAIEEIRLRTWARQNYTPASEQRDASWHPVIHDEMIRIDREN